MKNMKPDMHELQHNNYPHPLGILGWMYASGIGVTRNYRRAAAYLRLAARQGDAVSAFNLGILYLHGQGVHKDYAFAARYFQIAANAGVLEAQHNLEVLSLISNQQP